MRWTYFIQAKFHPDSTRVSCFNGWSVDNNERMPVWVHDEGMDGESYMMRYVIFSDTQHAYSTLHELLAYCHDHEIEYVYMLAVPIMCPPKLVC